MGKAGVTGLSANTPKHIMFGAGTIHKGLKYNSTKWNFDESIVGATSGGSKLSIKPKIKDIAVDGVDIKMVGLSVKTGETATLEVNFLELTKDIIKAATLGVDGTSEDTKYDSIVSKSNIVKGDYWENIAFVGSLLETGEPVIAILENALCTSGFEPESKSGEESVGKFTFECYGSLEKDLEKLPWKIYFPKSATALAAANLINEEPGAGIQMNEGAKQ